MSKYKDFAVDIVVPWVDGSDPEWLKERAEYLPQTSSTDTGTNRYRDWGLMPLWFETIRKYAPWVRTIHFVTWGHLPKGVNFKDSKIHIVSHRDFMPEEVLPTFNSAVIECFFHRIPGLAEHFIEFNDDVFLSRPTEKSDFFDLKTGLPKLPFEEMPVRIKGDGGWIKTTCKNMGILNRHLEKRSVPLSRYPGRYLSRKYPLGDNLRSLAFKLLVPEYWVGFKTHHTCAPFLKSTFQEVWEVEPEYMAEFSRHRFRQDDDINPWLMIWWQLAKGQFVPKKSASLYFNANEKTIGDICRAFSNRDAEAICINDQDPDVDAGKLSLQIKEAVLKGLARPIG